MAVDFFNSSLYSVYSLWPKKQNGEIWKAHEYFWRHKADPSEPIWLRIIDGNAYFSMLFYSNFSCSLTKPRK